MSRIGKKPILIPQETEVEIQEGKVVFKGPKGEVSHVLPEGILVKKENDKILVSPEKKTKKLQALWGLTRALLQNHLKGVTSGFEKKLEIRGIGYRASVEDEKVIKLEVGFSHPVKLEIPPKINVSIEKNIITISGIDKQKVGQFAANIRALKPAEPYKGKGFKYAGEAIIRKEKKKAAVAE